MAYNYGVEKTNSCKAIICPFGRIHRTCKFCEFYAGDKKEKEDKNNAKN